VKLQSIVVGMDFSKTAIQSAAWIARCVAPGAEITLVHVIDVPQRPRFAPSSVPSRSVMEQAAREYAQSEMKSVASFLTEHSVQCEIRVGKPHAEIAKVARERGADLIVVGPHGDRPRPRVLLGTTADRIVRTSEVPVLVGAHAPVRTPEQLLVAVEDAPITAAVLDAARSFAERFDATITLLNVWSNAEYSYVASMARATAANDADAQHEVERDLNAAARGWLDRLVKDGAPREQVRSVVTYGAVGDSILEVATAIDADLIVMGGRGSGLVAPALLGSTVAAVLHAAKCPVLVVREPE
jgi:universal stress protein E